MAYKDITVGEKLGKAVAMRYIESKKNKTPGVEVSFKFDEPTTGTREQLNWIGWLTPNAKDATMETLVSVLGYNGDETTDFDGVFTHPQVLDFNREVKLVIQMDRNEQNGKEYPKIRFVNRIGGSQFAAVAPQEVKSSLAKVGFKAAFLAAKQNAGGATASANTPPPPPPMNSDEEIPF